MRYTTFSSALPADPLSQTWSRPRRAGQTPLGSATTHMMEVRVLFGLPDVELVYAEDKNQNRYFIDADSSIDFELHPGQVLRAEVNDEGYVLKASLVRD